MAVWLPYLPIDRLERRQRACLRPSPESNLSDGSVAAEPASSASPLPLVVTEKVENTRRLAACDGLARRLGLFRGMPLADARAMVPELTVVEADPLADARLLAAVADWCDRFTPLVALDGPDGLVLDISGCAHLFGGEAALAHQLVTLLTRQGVQAQCAIAGTAVAARILAHEAPASIVPSGREALALTAVAVAALPVDDGIVRGLQRAGLKRIGDVVGRPPVELAARFGSPFVAVLDQALGRADVPISPRKPVPDYLVERRFAEPVATDAVITATLVALAGTLMPLLEQHGAGTRRLEAAFFRTDGAVRTIVVETGQPVSSAAVVERLFREKLDALADPLDPGFGFDLIRLAASRTVAVTPAQRGFDTSAHEAEDVAALVDRLVARFGRERIVRYLPRDSHVPERAAVAVPAQRALPADVAWPVRDSGEPPRRPLRLFARPEMIEVTALFPDGPPKSFTWRRRNCLLVRVEGPERIAMEWWHDEALAARPVAVGDDNFSRRWAPQPDTTAVAIVDGRMLTRDYFRAEDQAGVRYWIYREGVHAREVTTFRWFLHGLFA
jgi:protein ImuB